MKSPAISQGAAKRYWKTAVKKIASDELMDAANQGEVWGKDQYDNPTLTLGSPPVFQYTFLNGPFGIVSRLIKIG